MDELLRDFLTETAESLDRVDSQLVRLEQKPDNGQVLGSIFRVVHTIKGTCGFPRFAATGSADSRGRNFDRQISRWHAGYRRGRDAHLAHDRPDQDHFRWA